MNQERFRKWLVLGALSLTTFIASCTGFGPQGALVTSTTLGVYATEPGGSKTGKACTYSILGLVAFGDGSVENATKDSGIKTVRAIDLSGFSILGLYAHLCTVVTGD